MKEKLEAEIDTGTANGDILTRDEVSAIWKVTPRTLTNWMRRRWIPFYKIGKTVRFNRAAVTKHFEVNFVKGRRAA